jgi:uncharacterized protein
MIATNEHKKTEKIIIKDTSCIGLSVGKGLFSNTSIHKGELIFVAKGVYFKEKIKSIRQSLNHRHAIGISPQVWLNPFRTNPLRFLNHSCSPNVGIKGSVQFVALRDIKPNEHLTIDYSITECDILWNFSIQTGGRCKCGSSNCRKVIRSIQFLPYTTFKRYLPYVPTVFKKIYMRDKLFLRNGH